MFIHIVDIVICVDTHLIKVIDNHIDVAYVCVCVCDCVCVCVCVCVLVCVCVCVCVCPAL